MPRPLRLLSYLSPSIPEGLFALVAETVERATGEPVALAFETRVSGPSPEDDPFTEDRADVAFVCSPSYPLLKRAGSPIEILPAAAVFADPRTEGRPVYFADVVVRSSFRAARFEDLAGSVWSYNDRFSRSGWESMVARLARMTPRRTPESFFRTLVDAGSHLRSLELVVSGAADAAAIDSNVLWLARRDRALGGALRLVESWGPMPIQPVLARSSLDPATRARIAEALCRLHESPDAARRLEEFGVRRFARIDETAYAAALELDPAIVPTPGDRS